MKKLPKHLQEIVEKIQRELADGKIVIVTVTSDALDGKKDEVGWGLFPGNNPK